MPHEHRVIAVAADYADALLVARRAQRILILLLVLIVLSQIAIFATAHFAPDVLHRSTLSAATQPGAMHDRADVLHYVTAVSLFASLIFSILLTLTLFLTIHIMLVGRLVGVRDVTRALVLSFVLLFLFVPWQTLLVTQQLGASDYVIPGILFTWREVSEKVPLAAGADVAHQSLYWIRFAAAPLFGLILLLLVQVRSGRGLKFALGEEEIVPGVTDDGVVHIARD